ncbi:porin family protein [Salinimicrobium sp. CAU 1759]
MKKVTFLALLVLTIFAVEPAFAQEKTNKEKIEQLQKQKEQIIAEEKEALKQEVEAINRRAEAKEIDWEEAEKLKSEAAKKHAMNIQNRVAIIDNQIALLTREEKPDWDWEEEEDEEDHDNWYNKSRYSRTSTHMVMAVGFNNALTEDQSINDSDFKVGGSRFFELGIAWRTRIFERSNFMRLRYGFSFQFNGLKPTDNRYLVKDEELTVLETYPIELDKSKFRMDNLVFPVHFEFGPSKKVESDRSVWFSTHNKFKIGVGGYAGVNLGERQKLKYEADGENVKEKLKGDYNTNEFIYGLSGYIGFGGTSVYVKYDLNPIFKDPNPQMHNLSIGLRFDAN